MNITVNNYRQVFDDLFEKCALLENSGNKEVDLTLHKIKEQLNDIRQGGDMLEKENQVLKIGVVGQVKAGKSSFLNSLFFDGENVLPRASTPMTAGLTVLKYGEENKFEVEYYNQKEWDVFKDKAKEYGDIIQEYKNNNPNLSDGDIVNMANIDITFKSAKELVDSCSRKALNKIGENSKIEKRGFSDIRDLQDVLETYVGANGEFTPIVKSLTISINDERLKDIQIVDTPGINDPVLSREMRTREFLKGCHGVFLLSYSGRFFDSTDVIFLSERIGSQGIGSVVLIASKFDSVLQDVGMKFPDDLSSALSYCTNSLKKQYKTNISTSSFTGKDPKLEFSSGIGFSIAKKDEARWDDMERHVVKRMKSFYPSFFSTEKEIKDTFLELSQIDEIRDSYLEEKFKGNKEKIICEKVDSYFSNAENRLKRIISLEKSKLKDIADALKSSDIGEMEARKKLMQEVVSHVNSDIQSIANSMDELSEKNAKESLNEFHFSWSGKIPTRQVCGSFTCKGRFWGHNTFRCTYDEIDLPRLCNNLADEWARCIDELVREWGKRTDNISKAISSALNKVVTECLNNDSEGLLDNKVLLNLINETVYEFQNKVTLNAMELKSKFKTEIIKQMEGKNSIPLSYEQKEAAAKIEVEAAVRKIKDNLYSYINSVISSQTKDIETEIKNAAQDSINVVKINRSKFTKSVDEKTKDYLSNLELALKDKKKNLQIMNKTINELNKIEAEL